MSTENIAKFTTATRSNPDLQAKIHSAQAAESKAAAEKIAAIATEAGFPFTADEFLAASGELGPDQLDRVAGGRPKNMEGNGTRYT